jgi:hypothetical protein
MLLQSLHVTICRHIKLFFQVPTPSQQPVPSNKNSFWSMLINKL